MKRLDWALAALAVTGWYLLVYLVARPLADAPVVDSWIYAHAVDFFRQTGRIQFVGFTQAMPASQVLYGALWSRVFGQGYVSLDFSVATLGAIGGVLFYGLSRRCGAGMGTALLGTGLLVANPCYLFLSFSFMTEIPFLALLIASHFAFARAEEQGETLWLWVTAALTFGAFMVRPFAAAAIAGYACALCIFDAPTIVVSSVGLRRRWKLLVPLLVALILCVLAWIWTTVLNPQPWMLRWSEQRVEYFFDVPLLSYLRAGVLGPLFYLGVVLSPLAMLQLIGRRWRAGLLIAAGLFAAALVLVHLDPGLPQTPELSCFGGWRNALELRGLPTRFLWQGSSQWLAAALGALGAAGLILAVLGIGKRLSRGATAVILTAVFYWCGTIALWMFNDRYYLVLVPAGCLLLALAPQPKGLARMAAASVGLAALGVLSIAGVYDQQRGLETVRAALVELEKEGVPRSEIDAGYPFNGGDLYHYCSGCAGDARLAPPVPMVTSGRMPDYAITGAPIAGTRTIGRLDWPLAFGLAHRDLYIVRKPAPPVAVARARRRQSKRVLYKLPAPPERALHGTDAPKPRLPDAPAAARKPASRRL